MAKPGQKSKYKPSMCAMVEPFMAEGASLTELAPHFGVCRNTVQNWRDTYPDFADALKAGIELSEAWWEKQGRTHLKDKNFSCALWYMNMKNRFGWRDKNETSMTLALTTKVIELPAEGQEDVKAIK